LEITMGMRVSGSSGASQSAAVANWQQRQQSFQALTSALQSNDLAGAQQAFATLGGNSTSQGNGPLAQLGQALKNGDLAGAQQAAKALQSSRAKHHHHGGQDASTAAAQPSSSTSGAGTLINVTA
jgi:hypothetical protein